MLSLKYVSSIKRAESFVTLSQCGDNDDKNVHDSNEISDQTTPEALGIVFDENKNHSNQISAFQQVRIYSIYFNVFHLFHLFNHIK